MVEGYPIPGPGGYPIPGLDRGRYLGYPPVKDWMGYPPPRPDLGWGWVPGVCPQSKIGWGTTPPVQTWDGGYPQSKIGWGTPPSKIGWGTPPPGQRLDGVPPPPSAKRALATRRAVCLLRSRRRTFLLSMFSDVTTIPEYGGRREYITRSDYRKSGDLWDTL